MKFQWNSSRAKAWKSWWQSQFVRVDSLSLRERAFLFLSVLACGAALIDLVWLSPAQAVYMQSVQRFNSQNSELTRDRDALKLASKPQEAVKGVRAEILSLNSRLETVNRTLAEISSTARATTSLDHVLVHLLRQHEGLTLLRTDVSALRKSGNVTAAVGSGTGMAAPVMGLSTQSVALTVSGPYPELVAYLQTLEKALPDVRWEGMALKSAPGGRGPAELALQMTLMGVQQ